MCANSRIDWNVRAMPRATIALGRSPARLAPSKTTRPPSARTRPVTTLKNVVLPAPLGPMSPMMPPRGTTRSTALSATTPPNAFVTPRTSRIAAPCPTGPLATRSRSQAGMASIRAGGGASGAAGSSRSSAPAIGCTRRPASPCGRSSITSTRPSPKKNQRHSVRSIDASAGTPTVRPIARTRNVVCDRTTRSKTVISIAPSTTPRMLPAPPRTTMQSSMIETWNSKAPGVMACSFAA